jgi:cysteine synthase B
VLLAKLENSNPSGSVKDRAALAMIQEAERSGALQPGQRLIQAACGNSGIAAAMAAAVTGRRIQLIVPKATSPATMEAMAAYGADIVLTDGGMEVG